jgi:membrane fusion protein, multidrug efflux system
MRQIFSYLIALGLIAIIAVWIGSGLIVQGGKGPGKGERPVVSLISSDAEHDVSTEGHNTVDGVDPALTIAERNATTTGEDAPARSVRVKSFAITPMPLEVPLRGRTQAKAIVAAIAETTGIVDMVSVTKGQKVAEGDLLCTLDKGARTANLNQATAALARAQLDFDTNAKLRAKGWAANNTAVTFDAALKGAKAQLEQAQLELDRTEIRSKIAGVVQSPLAEVGSLLAAGQPCASVTQLDPMVFIGEVPEIRIGLAKLGLPAKITTVSGAVAEGKVSFIASTANDATRSFPVEIEIPNANGKFLAGLTAEASVNLGTVPAHLIPQSVLTLNDEGTLGVRSVSRNKVEFHPITIASDTRDGVWVLGLPPLIDIITVGQEFVKEGQIVNASKSDETAKS